MENATARSLKYFGYRPLSRRFRARPLLVLALLGGVYGAAIGSVVNAVQGAVWTVAVGAGIMAFLCTVPLLRLRLLMFVMRRARFVGTHLTIAAVAMGAVLGGFVGAAISTLSGAVLGGVAGWFAGRWAARSRRLLTGLLGAFLGICAGAMVLAFQRDPAAAGLGAALGATIGLAFSLLVSRWAVALLKSLPKTVRHFRV